MLEVVPEYFIGSEKCAYYRYVSFNDFIKTFGPKLVSGVSGVWCELVERVDYVSPVIVDFIDAVSFYPRDFYGFHEVFQPYHAKTTL